LPRFWPFDGWRHACFIGRQGVFNMATIADRQTSALWDYDRTPSAAIATREAAPPPTSATVLLALLRVLLVLMAVAAIATGVMLLTSPLAIPFVIGIWISAAVMVFLAVRAELPETGA
jgi:hypothetical protein